MSDYPPLHSASLHAAGLTGHSLIDAHGRLWLPYDIPRCATPPPGLAALSQVRATLCAREAPIAPDWAAAREVYVLNGMGVALGDNLIGLALLHALKAAQPHLRIVLVQAAQLPPAVAQLHALCSADFATLRLPVPAAAIATDALLIDLGDFAYWPGFRSEPMHDFFADALGLPRTQLDAATRANHWLQRLALPTLPTPTAPYILLAPHASSPLREIPADVQYALAAQAWQRYRLPILSFAQIPHPAVRNISAQSPDTAHFLAWVRGAALLIATDSAAIHAAAGFAVPTLAGFVCEAPAHRVAGYPHCTALDLRTAELDGRQFDTRPALQAAAHEAWRQALQGPLPWPPARLAAAH